jgi:hypothetical protein
MLAYESLIEIDLFEITVPHICPYHPFPNASNHRKIVEKQGVADMTMAGGMSMMS